MKTVKTEIVRIRCTSELKEKLRAAALAQDIDMADIVREAVKEWLARNGENRNE